MRKIVFIALIGFAVGASAHHGTKGQFDHSKTMEVSGTVTKIRFVNPHSYVYFDSANEKGDVENWRCEMRAATTLKRSGWSKEMFAAGTKIKIEGVPAFREPTGCYVNTIAFDDGEVIERYQQFSEGLDYSAIKRPMRLASGEPNISGDWAAQQRLPNTNAAVSAVALGKQKRARHPAALTFDFEQTEAGTAASAGFKREDNPRFHCKATNILFDWTFDQHINRIVQADDKITMTYGFMDIVRTIHMDLDSHPENLEPSRAGHSIGKWEGDTLVVDTIGFAEGTLDGRSGAKHSDQLHIVERYTLTPENAILTREYEVSDPLYLKDAYKGVDEIFLSETVFEPYDCKDLTEEVVEGF